ncbi:hypothetical protein WDZ92_46660 [Nostoc sp. NIES-2111]
MCDVEAQAMLVHHPAHLDGTTLRGCDLFRFKGGRRIYAEALYGDAEGHAAAGHVRERPSTGVAATASRDQVAYADRGR